MHPNTMQRTKTWVYGPMGRIGCLRCDKSQCDFMARTFVLIAPVHPVLNQVSCNYETIPNAPKHYATPQNMSLGSNGVDWVRSYRKIPAWLRGTSFRINCTCSPCFASSFMRLRNDPKCTQTLCNAPKHEFRVQRSGFGAFVAKKSRRDFVARTFLLIAPVHTVLHRVWCSYETIPNAPKHYATPQNVSLGSNGADWVRSLRKIQTRLRGMSFRINYTSSPCFASSFMRLRNDPKCTQTLCNAPKHEFRVQWSGLGAFIVKNPDVTSWHVLLH
jgi:hypothetical protein